jgi:4-diphosphocytidyl-2-C-methyl-D-erythritol kinase
LRRRRKNNLVWRAALGLAELAQRAPNVALTLVKNLPVTSGIGGGSSDAAAAIRALLDHWDARVDEAALQAFALRLGADVPVCLAPHAAWLGGIGEQVEAAPALPPAALVLVNPGLPLPTPAVFARREGAFSAPARFSEAPADAAALAQLLGARRNDLTDAALALMPEIGGALERLAEMDGALVARMSGSGATCFALFAEAAAAAAAAKRLRAEEPRWWVAAGRLVP